LIPVKTQLKVNCGTFFGKNKLAENMTDSGWKKYLPFESKKLNLGAFFFCAAISAHNAYNYFSPEGELKKRFPFLIKN